jgi:hypothetical protein
MEPSESVCRFVQYIILTCKRTVLSIIAGVTNPMEGMLATFLGNLMSGLLPTRQ